MIRPRSAYQTGVAEKPSEIKRLSLDKKTSLGRYSANTKWRPSAGNTTESVAGSIGRTPGFSFRKKNSLNELYRPPARRIHSRPGRIADERPDPDPA
ncbi:MAG: hypothetical protein CM1200mP29_07500 [Verrucomicrobiota bacterium]|nr:MAG: hypothetical protein CM1200mP29_07500 [Verrucomicrobiota bacterium]